MSLAITREISPAIIHCELTHLAREPINLERARAQHDDYERALTELGCQVRRLAVEPDLPDSVFVEDTAIVLDELAIITRPGAESRRPETISIAHALAPHRPLAHLEAPGTLDGGDVLRLGRTLYIGLSGRTNQTGIDQATTLLAPFDYGVIAVSVTGCLHLKSAVTEVAENTLLINRAWLDDAAFAGMNLIEVDAAEPFAANALRLNDTVIYPAGFPATQDKLAAAGINLHIVDVSELGKAEGGVTCCSLIFR